MWLELGASVRCEEKPIGHLEDVLVDAASWRLMHVAIDVTHRIKRLVPAGAVTPPEPGTSQIELACSLAELEAHEPIRRFAFAELGEVPSGDDESDVGIEDLVSSPSLTVNEFGAYASPYESVVALAYDRIPKGETELARSSSVTSSEGERVGHVAGIRVEDGIVTHLLVEHRHLWEARDVAVPTDAVDRVKTDRVVLRLTVAEIAALPALRHRDLPSSL